MAITKPTVDKKMRPEDGLQMFMFPDAGVTIKAKTREEAEEKLAAMQKKEKGA